MQDSAGPLTRPTAQERPRAVDQQELSWLMRTSYISNEVKAKRQQQAGQVGQHSDLVADEIQAIEVCICPISVAAAVLLLDYYLLQCKCCGLC